MNKKGFVDAEVIFSPGYVILAIVGYVAFFAMMFGLKRMEFAVPLWIKLVVIIAIPMIAYVFAIIFES